MTTYGPSIEVSLLIFWPTPEYQPLYFSTCEGCEEVYLHDGDTGENYYVNTSSYGDGVWEVDEHGNNFMYSEFYEKEFCSGCVEGDYPSTIVRFEAETGETEKVTFTDCYVSVDWEMEGGDWFDSIGFAKRAYVSTDGWRGYHDTKFANLTEVESGWVTGDWSDVPWKRDMHRFMEALQQGEIVPPVDLFLVFEPTSNVFSTACGLWAYTGQTDALREWLEQDIPFDVHGALG